MKKRGQGKRRRIFAVFLCLCVLFTTQPEIWNRLSVFAAEESDTKVILSFAELSEEIKEQTVPVGTVYEELELPEELNVYMKQTEISSTPNLTEEKSEEETVSGNDMEIGSTEEGEDAAEQEEYYVEQEETTVYAPENSEQEAQELQGVTWQSDPAYGSNTEETYIFTAVLPEGYTLAENVCLPQITVTVIESESGIDFVMQDLSDRIATLPDAEEYLASEPDMDDEDSYAEWREKLYEYAEEALDIWEECEALTEEQQAQISEEKLVKLTAWVELAETLEESSQVMTADDAQHKHCVCGGNINIGDHTTHTEDIVYDNILVSSNGQLLINGTPQLDYTLASGSYYLEGDVALSSELVIAENSEVYICLNNHTISYNRKNGKHRVITVEKGAKLYLCTCGDSGVITGGDIVGTGGGLYLIENSIFNMYGGSIEGNHATAAGGGIYSNTSCNLYKVNICGNKGVNGAGIIFSGTLNIYGGQIKNNEAESFGGGIATGAAQNCILQNVKICNNTAGNYAGGLYWSNGNLVMSDVEISNNIVSNSTARYQAGGVALMQGTISVSGAITISGNQYNGSPNNLCNTNANPRNPGKLFIAGTLDEQSVIGLTHKTAPTEAAPDPVEVASGNNHTISPADWSRFFSDDDTYEILLDKTNNRLLLSYPGSCDLFTLSTSGATLSPEFKASDTEYTSTVANSVDEVGITATLASTASGADIKIKINDGAETPMENGVPKTVDLVEGENTIVIIVTSGEMSKAYTIKITKEEAPAGFTVTLNGNGGSAGTNLTSYVPGSEVELPKDWMRTGYDFAGWYDNEDCTGTAVTKISATDTGDKEYWAKWEPSSYTISYDLDGGTVTGNPTEYTIESSAITLINPTKTGYSFGGWSGTDLTGNNNMSVTIAAGSTGDREYTAHWTAADYTVTLNGNGGQGGTSLISYAHGRGAILPTDWTRTGYTFAGWYEKADCTGTAVTIIPADATGNKEYWAGWTPISYSITYVLDGGNVSGNPTSYTIESSAITLNNPTREGYTFTGWSGTDLTGNNHMSVTIASGSTGHRTYTAHWKLAGYTVTLHTNGGTGGTDLTSYTFGTGATLPTDWKKTGYVFDGWYDNEGCTGTAVTNISGTDTGNKEYWAKWTDNIAPVIGTLTFNYQPKNFWHWLIGKDSLIITVPVTEEGSGADEISYTMTPDGGTAKVETAAIQNGEAKITVSADFKGTVSIVCADKAGNTSAGVTVGAGIASNGIIIEDDAPKIAFQAENAELLPSGEYKTVPNIVVTVTDDKDNAISGGIASVSYKIGNGSEQSVAHDYTTSMVVHDSFTIPASEIPANGAVITVTATDNAGNSSDPQEYTVKVHTHSGTLVSAVDPTCTTAGNKEHYTCTCGKLFSDSSCTNEITDRGAVVLDALGHHFEGEPYIVSTTQHWRKCSRCSVTEQKEDHTFDADDKCTVCGYSRAVDPGHTHSGTLIGATEPTCTLPGNIAYYSCSSCGKLFSDSSCTVEITEQETEIEALGHDFAMQKDQSEHWQQCSRCSLEQSRAPHVYDNDTDTECNVCGYVRTLPGHTHSGTLVAAKPATCTEDGNEAYFICSCGKWFSDSACTNEITDHASVTIGKLGHNFVGEYLFDANGHWKVCSRCNTAQTAENHVFDDNNDTTCNKCGYQRTIGTHTHSVERTVAATEPTCTAEGNKTYYICSCGKWFSDSACTKEVTAQDVTIPAKGHTAVTDPAKAATCTETGLSEGSHCSVCGHVIKAQTVTAALGHDYSGNYHYDAGGHWKVCSRCGAANAKQRHNYDNDRDTKCNDCGWVRTISDSGQDEQPAPTPTPEPPVPPTPQPPSPTNPPEQPQPTEKPDDPGTVPGTPDNSQPESTGTPEPTEKPSETGKEQQPEGDGEQTVPAAVDNGKIAISGEPVATGNVEGMTDTRTVLKLGNGAVIVTVVCAEQEYTAGVADTLAVANAVLTPEQIQLVNNGETIEIRIDVKDISDQVPEQDKEVIENGIEEYRKEVPGLVLGMYVDISMFIRIGEGDWNAITKAEEPVEIIIGIPEKLQEKDRAYYIIRAHDGIHTLMNDMDNEPSTITVSTDLFSSYAIAYVQAEGTGHKCSLCHICPTFLGICYFVWLAIIILIMIVVIILLRKKKENQEAQDTGQ